MCVCVCSLFDNIDIDIDIYVCARVYQKRDERGNPDDRETAEK